MFSGISPFAFVFGFLLVAFGWNGHAAVAQVTVASSASHGEAPVETVPEILKQNWEGTIEASSFQEFAALVRKKFGLNLYLHPSAIADCDFDNQELALHGHSMKLGKSLELMLDQFEADYLVDDQVVKIVSQEVVGESQFLTRRIVDFRPLIKEAMQDRLGLYSNDKEPPQAWEISMIVEEELIELIQQTVDPDSWDGRNGNGTIASLNGVFVILQTRRGHESVERLLRDLTERLTK
jgi:hypothetical protein